MACRKYRPVSGSITLSTRKLKPGITNCNNLVLLENNLQNNLTKASTKRRLPTLDLFVTTVCATTFAFCFTLVVLSPQRTEFWIHTEKYRNLIVQNVRAGVVKINSLLFSPLSNTRRNTGAVFVETAAVMQFLILLFVGTTQLGLSIEARGELSRIAYEGIRTAVAAPGLKVGDQITSDCTIEATNEHETCARALILTKQRIDRLVGASWITLFGTVNYNLQLSEVIQNQNLRRVLTIDLSLNALNPIPFHSQTKVKERLSSGYLFPGR